MWVEVVVGIERNMNSIMYLNMPMDASRFSHGLFRPLHNPQKCLRSNHSIYLAHELLKTNEKAYWWCLSGKKKWTKMYSSKKCKYLMALLFILHHFWVNFRLGFVGSLFSIFSILSTWWQFSKIFDIIVLAKVFNVSFANLKKFFIIYPR